jgi:hypothetical protein
MRGRTTAPRQTFEPPGRRVQGLRRIEHGAQRQWLRVPEQHASWRVACNEAANELTAYVDAVAGLLEESDRLFARRGWFGKERQEVTLAPAADDWQRLSPRRRDAALAQVRKGLGGPLHAPEAEFALRQHEEIKAELTRAR